MNQIQDTMDKLNAFESTDAIADFLMEKGVKGDVQDSDSCVITNWFLTETMALGCTTTEVKITVEDEEFNALEMIPSEVVSSFIREFDEGQYPDLIDKCDCDDCTYYDDYEY